MTCPGDSARGKEGIRAFRPRRLCPQEVGYTGLNMLGDTARGKEKIRGLDFPSDFARGKERIVVSTCPGN